MLVVVYCHHSSLIGFVPRYDTVGVIRWVRLLFCVLACAHFSWNINLTRMNS